ncbi:hypothetical protein BUE76_14565, partial [Cnuella takakiae]
GPSLKGLFYFHRFQTGFTCIIRFNKTNCLLLRKTEPIQEQTIGHLFLKLVAISVYIKQANRVWEAHILQVHFVQNFYRPKKFFSWRKKNRINYSKSSLTKNKIVPCRCLFI